MPRPSRLLELVHLTLVASVACHAAAAIAQSTASSLEVTGDSDVAAWAAERFAPTSSETPKMNSLRRAFDDDARASSPTVGNPLRAAAASTPPATDPFARPVAPTGDRYGPTPSMSSPPAPVEFAPGNSLRGGASVQQTTPLVDRTPATVESEQARQAFQPPSQPLPPSGERPISIGATAVQTPPVAELEPPLPTAAQPASDPFSDARPIEMATPEPARDTPPAPVPAEPPVKVASAYEPAPFGGQALGSEPAPLRQEAFSEHAEGVGRPGPHDLEGPQEAALVLEKRGPTEARIGHPCRFVVKVRNTGRGSASNVVLTDQTPAGARLVATVPTAEMDGSRVVWRLGTLEPGDERTVEMRLEPLREGALGSVATVSMDASASASTVCTRPQLALRMAAPPRVLVGDEQLVTIEVQNPGTGDATGVMLTSDIPPAVRHAAGPELEFEVGTLQAGENRRIELRLTAEQAGRVMNAVRVVGDGGLSVERSVEFDVIAPSLAVSIDGPRRRYLERPASYKIGVDNPGTAPAKDVRLVTHLPRGMEFVRANNLGEYDATTHSVYWSLAELPEGQRGEVEVVALPITPGDHTVRVESEAETGLQATEAHQTRVEGVAALAFEVRDLADPIEVGGDTTYEIRVLNEGTKAAANVRVRVDAPSGMRVVAAEGQTAHRLADARADFAPIAQLPPGAKAAYRVRLQGVEAGDQRVSVVVESDELSQPIRREESTRVFGDE